MFVCVCLCLCVCVCVYRLRTFTLVIGKRKRREEEGRERELFNVVVCVFLQSLTDILCILEMFYQYLGQNPPSHPTWFVCERKMRERKRGEVEKVTECSSLCILQCLAR